MKIILTGSTGFIGREVIEQCIQNPSITSIVALSRRELPESLAASPKVNVVIVDDYMAYTPSTLEAVHGADACIWSLGKATMPDNEVARKVSVDYTMAAARAFTLQQAAGRKMRFLYVSGFVAERDQTKSLWYMGDYRRIRGQVETELIAHAKANPDAFETFIMRPALVVGKEGGLKNMVQSLAPSVKVDVLAKAMIKVASDGYSHDTIENSTINELGRKM